MKDQYKTKTQLIEELEVLRKRVIKMEGLETERKRVEKALQVKRDIASSPIAWTILSGGWICVCISSTSARRSSACWDIRHRKTCGLYVVDLFDEDGVVQMREVIKNWSERKTDFT